MINIFAALRIITLRESPLFRLMVMAVEKGVTALFWIYVVLLDGRTMLVWDRRRVWVGFFLKTEGRESAELTIAMVEAHVYMQLG